MKHLFVNCDGTWATPDREVEGVVSPTNVVKLYNAIGDADADGNEQLKYYHPGVGTEGGVVDRIVGGGLGVGLGRNIMSAYNWLVEHYAAGDKIYLLGFSRGAYTVRCLSGMLSICGLLKQGRLNAKAKWAAIESAYKRGYRERVPENRWRQSAWKFHAPNGIDIQFLGVWDTVGALGVPDHAGVANLLDFAEKYRFADGDLASSVKHARHAIAIDELKASFAPALWNEPHPDDFDDGRSIKQVWFPGGHGDVGGGWPETGLSDGSLKWMIGELTEISDGKIGFESWALDQVRPNPQAQLHQKPTGIWERLPTYPRSVPSFVDQPECFHDSALSRRQAPPIVQAPYWKTRELAPGEDTTVSVYARDPWNATRIWLDADVNYRFKATGEWVDKTIVCGPGGCDDGNFQIGEIVHVFGSLFGEVEELFRAATNNKDAEFFGTRREEDIPWFTLVGAIANGENGAHDGTPDKHETFRIGEGCTYKPVRSGYLYCFANDAWGFYDNNRGHVRLTVTRVRPRSRPRS